MISYEFGLKCPYFDKNFDLFNLIKSFVISEEIVFIEFKKLFLSFVWNILALFNDSSISIAIKPHLANPAKGKVPSFLQFSTCQYILSKKY